MKKRILFFALIAQSTAALALSDAGSKYYIEGALGVSTMHSSGKLWSGNGSGKGGTSLPTYGNGPITIWGIPNGPYNTVPGGPGFAGSASIGYDHRFCNSAFVLGAFFGGGGTGAHATIPYTGTRYNYDTRGVLSSQTVSSAVTLSDKGFFTLGARFGMTMGPVFGFLRLGWAPHSVKCKIQRMGQVAASVNATEYTQAQQKQSVGRWIGTMLLGVGAEVNLTQRLIVGLLVEGHFGGKRDFQFKTGSLTSYDGYTYDTPRVRSKPAFTQYLLTFKYAMPSC